jgi:ATP-dependent RNA helicase DeaD
MKSFQDMSLPVEVQKALTALNFSDPTPIQALTIPLASEGKDFMACAETGSGKTAAYAIPTVVSLLADKEKHALILAPTRELAQQIADFFRGLIKYSDGLSVTALIGGADIYTQFRSLKKNPRILVATPGRLTDHLIRKSVKLDKTEILVLDEGDRMLDMGFAPQLDEILKYLPKKRQTSLFTATLPDKVRKLAERYLTNPEQVNVGRISLPVLTIKQSVVEMTSHEKENRLVDELNKREGSVIVFAKTKIRVDKLTRVLDSYGFKVDLIHGGRSQGQRNRALANFRAGKSRILCATDVASRGIDIPSVAHVINVDIPMMIEDYVHRIGRTGRNGASGEAVTFVAPEDYRSWMMIAKKYQIKDVELKNKPAGGGRSAGGRSGGRSAGGRDQRRGGGAGRGSDRRSGGFSDRKPQEGFSSFSSDRPSRPRFDREERSFDGERSESPFKKKSFDKPFGEARPARKFDRKPDGEFKREFKREDGEGFKKPFRKESSGFGRPERSSEGGESRGFSERKFGDKPFGEKKFGDKKFGDRKFGDKKFGSDDSAPSKRYSSKKSGDSAGGGFGEKKFGDRKFGDKKFGDKKFGDKKFGAKKSGGFKKSSTPKPRSFQKSN